MRRAPIQCIDIDAILRDWFYILLTMLQELLTSGGLVGEGSADEKTMVVGFRGDSIIEREMQK